MCVSAFCHRHELFGALHENLLHGFICYFDHTAIALRIFDEIHPEFWYQRPQPDQAVIDQLYSRQEYSFSCSLSRKNFE